MNENKNMKWMMFVMILCCGLPLFLIVLFGVGGRTLGFSSWFTLIAIAVLVGMHFLIMKKMHKQNKNDDKTEENKKLKDHSGCH